MALHEEASQIRQLSNVFMACQNSDKSIEIIQSQTFQQLDGLT